MEIIDLCRRQKRSENPQTALHFLCKSVAADCELDSIVITQPDGLLFSGTDDERTAHLLAAFSPILSRTEDRDARRRMFEFIGNHIPDARPARFSIRKVTTPSGEFVVTVRGSRFAQRDSGIRRVLSGISRIAA